MKGRGKEGSLANMLSHESLFPRGLGGEGALYYFSSDLGEEDEFTLRLLPLVMLY